MTSLGFKFRQSDSKVHCPQGHSLTSSINSQRAPPECQACSGESQPYSLDQQIFSESLRGDGCKRTRKHNAGAKVMSFIYLSICIYRPRCASCRLLVPHPGIEPVLPAVEAWGLTTGPPGKSPASFNILKGLYSAKETINKIKRQLTEWEQYLPTSYVIRG